MKPYEGSWPAAQEWAEKRARSIVRENDGELVSRQVIAVLRVLVDEISRLEDRIERLERRQYSLEEE